MKLTLILLAGCLLTPSSAIAEELFQKSPNIQNISKNISNMIRARASQDRINEVLGMDEVITETKNPQDNRVKAYKANSSIIKKKISFLSFLFKS